MSAAYPRRAAGGLLCLACALLMACSDSSDRQPESPEPPMPPEPPVEATSLDDTGIYQGTVITEDRNVALLTATLARDGHTSLAIETGDSEQADIVLWGMTEEADDTLNFTGTDSRDGSSVELTFAVDDEVLSSEFRLAGLVGEASASRAAESESRGAAPEGRFARQDSLAGLSDIEISSDGSIKLLAPCDGSGELSTPDAEVNIYRITVVSDCLEVDALASVDRIAGGGQVLLLSGNNGLATRLYQP